MPILVEGTAYCRTCGGETAFQKACPRHLVHLGLTVLTAGDDSGPGRFFIAAVLLAPVIETLSCQALPIFVVRWLRGPFTLQVLVSTAIFAALHFMDGIVVGVVAGLVGGFYLAFTYAHWCRQSHWTALWVTAGSHALNNYLVFLILAAGGQL